jgi:glycosyltransferase involved in cell wall biosynthesis
VTQNAEIMRFGVVLPARNESKALPELISGIRSSIHKEFPDSQIEILVVDDGSIDNVAGLVDELNDELGIFKFKILLIANSL